LKKENESTKWGSAFKDWRKENVVKIDWPGFIQLVRDEVGAPELGPGTYAW
jgi:hypothetical protein